MNIRAVAIGVVMIIIVVVGAGCQGKQAADQAVRAPATFEQLYDADLNAVDYMEIRNGSTGELQKIEDKAAIAAFIEQVRQIELIPEPDQQDRTGFRYSVSLYEKQLLKISFTPTLIAGHYYQSNTAFFQAIEAAYTAAATSG